jgi:dipeptidase D
MRSAIDGLKPALVWKYFAEISRIPRGSKNETAIAKYLVETARRLGLEATQDATGNVLAGKPASPGREGRPAVCLQGHMDMVCEKNKDKAHDFLKDPIELVRDGEVIRANGTTLGADNGIAVATSLAIMEDKTLQHGPLEFLFTVDEETGLTGANGLQPGFLRSQILLNLDSEDEGELYVGCSGGRDNTGTWPLQVDAVQGVIAAVKVTGLRGGHSGLEIHTGRGNALKIVNRVAMAIAGLGGRLAKMEGGNKRNAIPREAEAHFFVPKSRVAEVQGVVDWFDKTVKEELATVEPKVAITLETSKGVRKGRAFKRPLQKRLLLALSAMPHGVLKMSADIPGLVETSTNLAIVQTTKKVVSVQTSQRSSVASEIDEASHAVRSVFELAGAEATGSDGYPGWKPNLDSPILKLAKETYHRLYGKEPEVKAVHAGLECGIIGEKYPGMDMVSFGPTMKDVHSPVERLYVDTVPRFYEFLLAVLASVA